MKQKIIILGGADMVGKTQIALELSRRLSIPYFKSSSEHSAFLDKKDLFLNQLRYSLPQMVDFIKQTGVSVVFDRSYPCERVYSRVLNRQTDLNILDYIDKKFSELGAKIVVCRRSSYVGIVDDLDPKLNSEVLQRLDDHYLDFQKNFTRCDTYSLNVDDEDLDREVNEVIAWLEEQEKRDEKKRNSWSELKPAKLLSRTIRPEVSFDDEPVYVEHKKSWCAHCQTTMVLCKTCGNNTCNGGHGTVNGEPCPDCDDAYKLHDILVEET